jgi:2-keto-4-pentenoate hydratase/2-oxohepta-3-ene-1,7-dioic acid hydratase in catechol pathway
VKLVVYGPQKRLGAVESDNVIDLNSAFASYLASIGEPLPSASADAMVPNELGAFIEAGERGIEAAQRAVDHAKASDQPGLVMPLGRVKLHAPYSRRCRIMMAGGNYVVHSQGMTGRGQTLEELYNASRTRGIWGFYCFPENAAGPDEPIIYPSRTDRLDYEGEVAVIIGKKGKDIAAKDAAPYFWGYMLQNDVSARNSTIGPDNPQSGFTRAKNFDTSICGGPYIAVGEFSDPQNIDWETRVNGQVRQQGNTKGMTFSFAEYLEYMSDNMYILPGDVISAGTTAGTAQDSSPILETPEGRQPIRAPELFLHPGDVVEVSNAVMGTLRNPVVAKPAK